jgi:hypothetical protein
MSKDGYETEISRVQSKRNLFKFLKSYFVKETNFITHPEEYWWKIHTSKKQRDIEESFQQFILDTAPQQVQEDFAYEGIFDKKKDVQTPQKASGSRMDVSMYFNTMNRSKILKDDYKMVRNNASHIVLAQDDVSEHS